MAKEKSINSASNRPSCSTVVLYLCVVALFVRVELLNSQLRKELESETADGREVETHSGLCSIYVFT